MLQVNNQGVSAKLKYWNSTCNICFLVAWHSKAVALCSWSYQRYSQDFSIFLLLFLQPVVQLSLCQKTPSSNPPPLLIVSFKFMQLNPLAGLVQHGCSKEAGENEDGCWYLVTVSGLCVQRTPIKQLHSRGTNRLGIMTASIKSGSLFS